MDCNAGNHGKSFATNFNPEINLREVTQNGRYWKKGEWITIPALSIKTLVDHPAVGPRASYLIYHEEEEESLVRHIRGLKQIRFWMTFGDAYIKHLEVFQSIGLTRGAVRFEGGPSATDEGPTPRPWTIGIHSKTPGFAALSVRGIRGSPRATVGGHPAGPGC